MVKKMDFAVFKVSDFELESVDLARILHKGLAFFVLEHVVGGVWFRLCHLREWIKNDLRLCKTNKPIIDYTEQTYSFLILFPIQIEHLGFWGFGVLGFWGFRV